MSFSILWLKFVLGTNYYKNKKFYFLLPNFQSRDSNFLPHLCCYKTIDLIYWFIWYIVGLNTGNTSILSVSIINAGKYKPEKLRIRTVFTQFILRLLVCRRNQPSMRNMKVRMLLQLGSGMQNWIDDYVIFSHFNLIFLQTCFSHF